jgi:hypothetical protein
MKKVFLIFLLSFLSNNVTTAQSKWEVIGTIENGVAVLTINKAEVLNAFNANLLSISNINGKFNDVTLSSTDDGNYLLVFIGTVYRASLFVKKQSTRLIALTTTSCATSACFTEAHGCVVMYDSDEIGYCSPCSNGEACTKTSSSTSLIKTFD